MVRKCFTQDLARLAGLAVNRFPRTDEEVSKAEDVLAKELENLSLDEHEKIIFDVHGLTTITNETRLSLEEHIQQLEQELDKIDDKEAYNLALEMNPSYVKSPKFQLMFLRAESFDHKAAAEMLVAHFEVKRTFFGDGEVLARDVMLSDLNEEEVARVEHGYAQVLPSRDASGRLIVVMSSDWKQKISKDTTDVSRRAAWFFNMEIIKDEEAQIKGIVLIIYHTNNHHCDEINLNDSSHQMKAAIPHRVDASHICFSDPQMHRFVTGLQLFVNPHFRYRLRSHCGSPEEIEFKLQTYGIPTDVSPMQRDGSWSTSWHKKWMAAIRANEEALRAQQLLQEQATNTTTESTTEEEVNTPPKSPPKTSNELIIIPRRFDVLFGKGRKARTHTGNLRAMHLCDMHWSKYEAATKYGKTEVAERIVTIIKESHGRFLKSQKSGWVEVDDDVAREKISHFFRHMRSKARTGSNASPTSSEEFKAGEDESSSSKFEYDDDDYKTAPPPAKRVTPCPSPNLVPQLAQPTVC